VNICIYMYIYIYQVVFMNMCINFIPSSSSPLSSSAHIASTSGSSSREEGTKVETMPGMRYRRHRHFLGLEDTSLCYSSSFNSSTHHSHQRHSLRALDSLASCRDDSATVSTLSPSARSSRMPGITGERSRVVECNLPDSNCCDRGEAVS
jgi:hypothetical protein